MIQPVFSVYDAAAKAYLPTFNSNTVAMAIRSFKEAVNATGTNFNKYAADYTLFEIGIWDDSKGITENINHINHGNALTFINEPVLDEYNPDETLRAISIAKEATS